MKRVLANISLLLLFSVVILRPLVAETYDSSVDALDAALTEAHAPTPLRTLLFDLCILLAACGWLWSRATGAAERYRRTGLEIGVVILVLAAIVSCAFAGNQRLAINATIDWLCLPLLTVTLAHLIRSSVVRRLVVAGVLATACVQALECVDQYFVAHADTLAHYESIKDDFWAQQGVDLSAPKVELYERRLKAHEAQGFLPHSNITGSYLALCAMAAMALTTPFWLRFRERPAACVAQTVAALFIATALCLTKSLGAFVSVGLGLGLWIVLRKAGGWCAAHRSRAFLIGWLIVGAGGLATVAYGLARDTLPHMSLHFRWQYWSASADLVADHWLTGVGRENFGRHYLAYKTIASPEEVANPHNLFVQAASDWGLAGLAGVVALLLGGSWVLIGYGGGEIRRPGMAADAEPPASIWPALVVGLCVVCGLRIPLLGSTDPNYVYYITVTNGMVWLIAFCCFAFARPSADRERPNASEETGGTDEALLNTGLTVALVAFLVHDLINFALFVPATATTFAALLGVRLSRIGAAPEPTGSSGKRHALVVALGATLTVGAILWAFVLPVARAQDHLARARRMAGLHGTLLLDAQGADRAFLRAALTDRLDPTPHSNRAAWLASVAASMTGAVDEALSTDADASFVEARRRDPHNRSLVQRHAAFLLRWARTSEEEPRFATAVRVTREALALYPTDPRGMVRLADCLLEAGTATNTEVWVQEADATYVAAVELDSARPWPDEIRRLTNKEQDHIRVNRQRAGDWLER